MFETHNLIEMGGPSRWSEDWSITSSLLGCQSIKPSKKFWMPFFSWWLVFDLAKHFGSKIFAVKPEYMPVFFSRGFSTKKLGIGKLLFKLVLPVSKDGRSNDIVLCHTIVVDLAESCDIN